MAAFPGSMEISCGRIGCSVGQDTAQRKLCEDYRFHNYKTYVQFSVAFVASSVALSKVPSHLSLHFPSEYQMLVIKQ